jgi:hypothetical protein
MNQGASCSTVQEALKVGIDDPAHPLCFAYPDHQGIQRIVLAAPGPETVREPEQDFLIELVQYGGGCNLHNLVIKRRHGERSLPSVGFRYIPTPGWLRSVRSPMDPGM